jgi:hypothetical protein
MCAMLAFVFLKKFAYLHSKVGNQFFCQSNEEALLVGI